MKTQRLTRQAFAAIVMMVWTQLVWCVEFGYQIKVGRNEPMCRALQQYVNENRGDDTRCTLWDLVSSFSQFSEPPWEELDVKNNKELLFKIMRNDFADAGQLSDSVNKTLESNIRKGVDDFVRDGGRMRLWRTGRSILFMKNQKKDSSSDQQIFVQTGINSHPSMSCTGTSHSTWQGGLKPLQSDLSGVDSGYAPNKLGVKSHESALLDSGSLFIYKGVAMLVAGGGAEVYQFKSGSISPICEFKH